MEILLKWTVGTFVSIDSLANHNTKMNTCEWDGWHAPLINIFSLLVACAHKCDITFEWVVVYLHTCTWFDKATLVDGSNIHNWHLFFKANTKKESSSGTTYNTNSGKEITWQEFRVKYLEQGEVSATTSIWKYVNRTLSDVL